MFRRWLRKLSSNFDWQERRLQALSKALEAACGTKCCRKYIEWLRTHARDRQTTVQNSEIGDSADRIKDGSLHVAHLKGTDATHGSGTLERYKEVLLQRNRSELSAFDLATSEMKLESTSIEAKQRERARLNLVAKHKSDLVSLVGEWYSQHSSSRTSPLSARTTEPELPLSASCRTVTSIASELMRHILDMRLYYGGQLVGEAVSLYLVERAISRDKRVQLHDAFHQSQQKPIDIFAMQREVYDIPDQGSDGDDDSHTSPLSDDDDLDNADSETLVRTMRNGILPPELRFLYGLCVAGAGGKVYLASSCLQAVCDIRQESVSWLTEAVVDTSVTPDWLWHVYHYEKTQPLGRISALSFAVEVLNNIEHEHLLLEYVAPLFRGQVATLKDIGMLDLMQNTELDNSFVCRHRLNQIVRIVIAEARYEVEKAGSKQIASDVVQQCCRNALESFATYLPLVWNAASGSSMTPTQCEAIIAISRTFRLISLFTDTSAVGPLEDVVNVLLPIVSTLCASPNLSVYDADWVSTRTSDLGVHPISSAWLTSDLASLSLRSYNLCVGMNIDMFSGWEVEEFSLRVLRSSSSAYIGVTVEGGLVAGRVSASQEEELIRQWTLVQDCVPGVLLFDFQEKLRAARATKWYQDTRRKYAEASQRNRIDSYEEEDGLSALLAFSRLLLVSASKDGLRDKSLFMALSILLPVTQFCLNEVLWDARMGQLDPLTSSSTWLDVSSALKSVVPPSARPGYIRPSKRATTALSDNSGDRALHEWFSWEDSVDPLMNRLDIPLPIILKSWRQGNDRTLPQRNEASSALAIMSEVDACVGKLRCSYTAQAVEKAALQVAASLLAVVACPDCSNPFVCIQQATMYASLSPKGGTSDRLFQAKLPRREDCLPIEALLILGRAECLNALHFCQEAAFLTCYVIEMCGRSRRVAEKQGSDFEKWIVIAALAYDLSVTIRIMSRALLRDQERREDTSGTWDGPVIEEFRQARLLGLDLKSCGIDKANESRSTTDFTWLAKTGVETCSYPNPNSKSTGGPSSLKTVEHPFVDEINTVRQTTTGLVAV